MRRFLAFAAGVWLSLTAPAMAFASAFAAAILLLLPATGSAHRLDEYLQATLLSVASERIEASVRLVPGVAVSSAVIANIDANGDGMFSEAEQQAYALRVLRDLSLSVDNQPLALRLISASFPAPAEMMQGLGEIELEFTADLPGGGANRHLRFENHFQSNSAVYLVNCLVSRDKNIRIGAQTRNENQSSYQLDFVQGNAVARNPPARSVSDPPVRSVSGLAAAFHLGIRHIAGGTDHLLFLLALLLPAPLLACGGRWREQATIRRSLLNILSIVTAFTLGHSLTLALAAFGIVSLPSRPVEVLIAVSILVSAIHAIRPLFPGREAVVATFFGLIHGLAFASALSELGVGQSYGLITILGFNLGIEAMQLVVVIAVLPSLLLMSRTRIYWLPRIGGALLAALASTGWIVERVLNVRNVINPFVEDVAHNAEWIAAAAFLVGFVCWFLEARRAAQLTAGMSTLGQ